MTIDRTTTPPAGKIGVRAAAAGIVLALLASCGGHDDGGAPPVAVPVASNTPPSSASGSVDGFIAFLKTLITTKSDTAMPLDVSGFVAPVTDTGLPDPGI